MRTQVGLKAYLLWESNGKPDGGDFSGQARAELETELRRGMSLQELERRLKTVRRRRVKRRLVLHAKQLINPQPAVCGRRLAPCSSMRGATAMGALAPQLEAPFNDDVSTFADLP